jgi:hypothetical protein
MPKKEREYDRILRVKEIANKQIAEIEAKEAKKQAARLNDKEKQLIKLYRSNPALFEGYLKAI